MWNLHSCIHFPMWLVHIVKAVVEIIGALADRFSKEAKPWAIQLLLKLPGITVLADITEKSMHPQGLYETQIENSGIWGYQPDISYKHQMLTYYTHKKNKSTCCTWGYFINIKQWCHAQKDMVKNALIDRIIYILPAFKV